MNEPRNCPKCGTPLPGDAMDGLCPSCMGRVVFGEGETDKSKPEAQPAATAPSESPSEGKCAAAKQ